MKLDPVAVAGKRDIGGMPVKAGSREPIGAIDGHTLGLVDRRRVAVIDLVIVLYVERDRSADVELNRHACSRQALDVTKRAVLDPKATLILQEHDPVAGRKPALATLSRESDILAKSA